MRTQFSKLALVAAFGLAMAFTFGCSSDNGGNEPDPQPLPVSSSSGGNGSVSGSSSSVATGGSGSSSSTTGNGGSSSSGGGGSPSEYTGGSCNASDYGRAEIGGKVWMAKNWGCYASGSKCYDNDPANCTKYGRLYDWATAMALPSKCNTILSTSDAACAIRTPHQGICPSGWHIPTNAEWDALFRSADGTSGTSSPYDSPTAGKHLKAKEGWNNCGPSGSGKDYLCEDTFGFSALPGGYGSSFGFGGVGNGGDWWSALEGSANLAYVRDMNYNDDGSISGYILKGNLQSVRCLQD